MEDTKKTPTAEEMKTLGNECVKEKKYIEAVMHYTQAIKLEPKNFILYSNRSFAFLKMDQLYLSLQDANETISLNPNWAKGYFRRAEVESASGLHDEAIISYSRALHLEPSSLHIMASIKQLTEMQKRKQKIDQNIIWISTCVGLILGIIVVILDYTLTKKPTLGHPVSMVGFTVALSGMGYGVGKATTMVKTWSSSKSLAPPADLFNNEEPENETVIPEKRNKYSKAQARHRYKQGKN